MSAPEDLEALYDVAVAAMDAGDYLTAKQGFMNLVARRATVPDLERSLGAGGRQSIRWRDVDLKSLIDECNKMLAAARSASRGPFTAIPIRYVRPGASDSY